ncbi:hypothetical protein I5L01_02810 [Erythrobacter sp. YJ-T3-07]|uniref:hypothetical protein n=1 Tax=Erythrobacter sp. YJ-T3-07 TaxID=2793063 RepID=UPI0018D3FFA4|nr:hypothetical protein [Erythrobacter sp. YJ-T3-07]MBH1943155.1 hypothetical protein [Erythrobacter sp. YJ-T3-07]
MITGIAGNPVIEIPPEKIVESCRAWLAPILTLLGLVCATNAFMFSAVDRSEFKILRAIGVESQLWKVFSEMIFWLTVAAISSAFISLSNAESLPRFVVGLSTFLFFMTSLCLLKFSWVMRHVIGARIRRSELDD